MKYPPKKTFICLLGAVAFFTALFSLSASVSLAEAPKTLRECFEASLKKSETFGIQNELVIQADENRAQAYSAIAPSITGVGTYFMQQTPDTLNTNFYPASQTTLKITGVQPLFRGFREYAAIRLRKNLLQSQEYQRQLAGLQLFEDLATSFYAVLTYEQDLRNYDTEIAINVKRLNELMTFRKIGRSRESEVLTLQVNIASLQAQLESSKGALASARKTLEYLTGFGPETTLQDNEEMPAIVPINSVFLDQIEKRPDVKAAIESQKATEENRTIAFGGHLPSLDLLGDYFITRPGLFQGVNWDFQLALSVPIFSGGLVQSQVRIAASAARQSDLLLSQIRQLAREQIETFYSSVTADLLQAAKLANAADLASQNYRAELRDYRNGLVTNVEVLQAITSAQESQRLLDRAKFQGKLDFIKLQAASAKREELALLPPVTHEN